MKKKSLLLTAVATLGLTAATMAQSVPSYVPTNGLVGWWPFNGNANDESGNGNNGVSLGVSLELDRNGNSNKALGFWNSSSSVTINTISQLGITQYSVAGWFKKSSASINQEGGVFCGSNPCNGPGGLRFHIGSTNQAAFGAEYQNCSSVWAYSQNQNYADDIWHSFAIVFNSQPGQIISSHFLIFIDGIQIQSVPYIQGNTSIVTSPINNNGLPTILGNAFGGGDHFKGLLDDIGIWNRALTQQEITDLYNAVNCANNTTITPQTNSLATGSTATFTATTSDPNPSFVWQSDLGQGFQTLNNFGNYSGVNTATLSINNVQLPNHTQRIRVISTSGNCIDTSNIAVINILDTCITNVTVYDTLLTTVTDTLVINTQITGINPPNNLNTLKVFPNPASTHITIDYGNFNAMSGYTLTIVNSIGQTVFTTPINQQTSYIDLSTWTGNGIYFVQLIDPQNNTIVNRKIVIQ
jgi:hypothetical protein